ncbi:uncharacterized protein ACN427_011840 isoform 4-T5 [Glossina fuscipes fuscipes]
MEIMANASNHNQNHQHQQQQELGLLVAIPKRQQLQQQEHYSHHYNSEATGSKAVVPGSHLPFQREVREWQRIDPDTGALHSGRLEADRWINGPLNSYGKISDSKNISQPNGTQHIQRKQLEVLQACTEHGTMQVIRAQTVQATSSRWSISSASPVLALSPTSSITATSTKTTTTTTPQLQKTVKQYLKNKNNSNKKPVHNHSSTTSSNAIIITTSCSSNSSASSSISSSPLTNGYYRDHRNEREDYLPTAIDKHWPQQLTDKMSNLHMDNEQQQHRHYNHDDYHCNGDVSDHDNDMLLLDADNPYLVSNDHKQNKINTPVYHRQSNNKFMDNNCVDSKTSLMMTKKRHHTNALHCNGDSGSNCFKTDNSNDGDNNGGGNNQFRLDTAPSLKLSNLMKSSSTLSTTGSTGQTLYVSTVSSKPASMNTYKSGVNKISLHAIVGNGSGSGSINKLSTLQQQQHQPTLFSQNDNISIIKNSNNNDNNNNNNNNNNNSNQSHLLKTRVGANINCNFDGGDEYQTSAKTTKMTTATAATPSPTVTVTLETRHHQHHHNDRLTPTQSIGVHTQQKRDEENFRHYVNSDVPFNEQDANDLRLSTRQLRRQQIPLNTSLQRSYSISTDDLSSEWNVDGHAEEIGKEEPAEWRRVSKLRRSFQSSNKTNESLKSPAPLRKPLDLPENSVSVSKIKADLENGRRLSTVMRNNRVDLTALNTLLQSDEINGREDHKTHLTKKNSFLTAESLKEIRNKLKKLSDESLYKEDFKIHQSQQQPTNEEAFNEELTERFKPVGDKKQANLTFVNVTGKHASNSLESRLKYKDPNSTEWHLRRKSYGFEKMSPPEYKAMFCMDDSTDSGLGRSGELGNWSPISDTSCKTNSRNSTIIHLEETAKSKKDSHLSRGYLTQKLVEKEREISPVDKQYDMKRHSIAIDDIHYDLENPRQTTQIHLNGVYEDSNDSLHTTSQKSQQKRVEFCKTEVHFATESGRVNIVETDSKPPPTNNFRRRRRSSSVGPLQSLVKSVSAVHTSASPITTTTATVAVPITIFGESSLKRATINTAPIAQRICLEPSPEPKTDSAINVTITVPSKNDLLPNYASTSGVDSTDCDTDEFISLRGILKNKPIKPKPYVLGENIENSKALWSTYKKLETVDDDSKSCSPPPFLLASQRTVAERIRLVEQQQQQQQDTGPKCSSPTSNFSTKINVNLGDRSTSWQEADLPLSNVVSIKFHSPQMKKEIDSTYTGSIKTSEALPPNLSNTHESTATLKQSPRQSIAIAKEALKIVKEARGARQLREHELSYFGVSKDKNNVQPLKTKLYSTPSPSVSTKRTLPSRRLSEGNPLINKEWPNKDNKPDLLKHSEIQMREITKEPKASERSSLLTTKNDLNSDEEHLYENIANDITPTFKVQSPSLSRAYDRKADLQRDAMILKEMNTNADQTLKDLSDETILRDRRRRSMQRRNSKPLETIEEKSAPEKSVESPAMVVKVDRATYSSEAKRIARRSTASPSSAKQRERTSSQSSVECCPRARSRSLSSEKEFETLKMKQAPNSAAVKHKSYKTANARSYSRESQNSSHSQCSSTDEQLFDSFRREERSRAKTKRHTNSSTKALKQTTIQSNQKEDAKRLSSTARSSTHRERVRCKMETVAKPSQHQNQTNPSLFRSTNSSGESGRRQRDELKDLQQSVKYCDTTAANISANNNKHSSKYDDKKKATSQEISSFKHVEQNNESEEKHIKPKAHSSRSTSKQRRHQHPEAQLKAITREREQLKSRTTKASTAAINENTTYVSVSNLRQVQTALCTSDTNVNNEIMQTAAVIADTNIYEKSENFEAIDQSIKQSLQSQIPIKPPRKKRYKKSLIPIAIPTKPERLPPLSPSQKLQIEKIPSPPSYEYQVKTQIIPPSYSNQSTLKKSSLPRPTSRLSFLTKARKSSHKYAHSTSSSFAFLPYLPAKRNSDVSHIYDNYMLYAVPASINAKAYKQNLVNDHAHLFGGTGHRYYNDGGKGLRRRTVRSTVSTHQPFGICTCS